MVVGMSALWYLQFQVFLSEISFVDLFHNELSTIFVSFSSVGFAICMLLIVSLEYVQSIDVSRCRHRLLVVGPQSRPRRP